MKGCNSVLVAASLLFFCVLVPMCGGDKKGRPGKTELGKKRTAERILKESLNYPDSYSLQGWKVEGDKVTLEYKAKNAFGMERTERTVITVD